MSDLSDVTEPAAEAAQVESFWRQLGLPGLVDIHVHVMPPRLLTRIWQYFDAEGPLTGRAWPIRYRWPQAERMSHLRGLGVRAFPTLLYAHKPGMAESLNAWARDFALGQERLGHRDVVQAGTFFPEAGAASYVEAALRQGARVFKAHVQVGGFDPRDPLLDPVWGLLADRGTPVVVHAGSGPEPGAFTGPGPFGEVLRRHPQLTAVIAHMGMPDHADFLTLAERYERVHLDTTMCFVDFLGTAGEQTRLATSLAGRLSDLRSRVVLGSDYPNIPYPYLHQLHALRRTGLDDDWLRAVLWHNGASLLRLDLERSEYRPCPD